MFLQVKDLKVNFNTHRGVVRAVRGVSFGINESETFGLVGESGSGKSVTAYSIMRILQIPPAEIINGEINFRDENLLLKTEKEMRKIRGNKISIIFQEPMTSLNPVFTVGNQCAEVLKVHTNLSNKEIREKVVEMFGEVKIPDPAARYNEYPHQLSGGLRQRVMIAMALLSKPDLLIADEPTTALDVTIQAQILELLKELQNKYRMALLLITHDLGLVKEMTKRVGIMYAGEIVEISDTASILNNPKHPYTIALMDSLPKRKIGSKRERLNSIKGTVPDGIVLPGGCAFHPRCRNAKEICKNRIPELREIGKEHLSRCIFAEEM